VVQESLTLLDYAELVSKKKFRRMKLLLL